MTGTPTEILKAVGLLFVAALVQVSIATPLEVASGHPDVVLLTLVAVAMLRGPLVGAVAGFWAGLVVDVAALQALGLTSLLLTLAGYWAGRFGELTTRESPHPPLIAAALATVGVVVGSGLVHFMLGQGAPASALLGEVLLPTVALNVLLAYPVYRLCARLFPVARRERREAVLV
ncbi:MAG: rod shape-determining protein MreD [Actinomycetota bacterium]|nr:rod shape-determining protein MreD [Actinomycetota bacterium]